MAVRAAAVTRLDTFGEDGYVITWSGLLNGDTGDPVGLTGAGDRSIQFDGTFGVGGTIIPEGSNDVLNNGTYFGLRDSTHTAISKTAAGLEQILEITNWLRPRVTAGDGTTSLVARAVLSRRPF